MVTIREIVLEPIERTDFDENLNSIFPIPLKSVWCSDSGTLLGNTASSPNAGLYAGTHGSAFPYIGTEDLKNNGSAQTRKCRFSFQLPHTYVPGGAVFIRAFAGAVTTDASVAMTIDFTAYKRAATGVTVGSDLVTTSAIDINDVTMENRDFAINPNALAPGDQIVCECTLSVHDSGTATAVIAAMIPAFGCTTYG